MCSMHEKFFLRKSFWFVFLLTLAFLFIVFDSVFNTVHWQKADRQSAGFAPLPSEEKEAVVQLYAARTYNWRKYFAVHSWIAVKEKTLILIWFIKFWALKNGVPVLPLIFKKTFRIENGLGQNLSC